MVIDLFYLLNELDLLEVRLNILSPYVDKFVIIESVRTFSGITKDLCFQKNRERFAKWNDKIIYHIVDDFDDVEIQAMAISSPNTGGQLIWVREFYIKEYARRALKYLDDSDIVFISDLDEIWNPKLSYEPKGSEVLKPKQIPYLYYFNQRTDENWLGWTGTTCCRYETIKNGIINHIRTDELTPYSILENGGWHFNSIGGKERKQRAAQHPLVDSQTDWDRREINIRKDETDWPDYLKENRELYLHYLL